MKAKEIYLYSFAALFVIGYFVQSYLLKGVEANSFTVGVIETTKMGVILILGYFFGSSKSSSDKNELLKKDDKSN